MKQSLHASPFKSYISVLQSFYSSDTITFSLLSSQSHNWKIATSFFRLICFYFRLSSNKLTTCLLLHHLSCTIYNKPICTHGIAYGLSDKRKLVETWLFNLRETEPFPRILRKSDSLDRRHNIHSSLSPETIVPGNEINAILVEPAGIQARVNLLIRAYVLIACHFPSVLTKWLRCEVWTSHIMEQSWENYHATSLEIFYIYVYILFHK